MKQGQLLLSERRNAAKGHTLVSLGAWIGVPCGLLTIASNTVLGAIVGLPQFGARVDAAVAIVYVLGVLLMMIGTLMARKALGLNGFSVVLSLAVAAVVPVFLAVLAWSLSTRFNNYFTAAYAEEKRLNEETVVSQSPLYTEQVSELSDGSQPTIETITPKVDRIERLERLTALWKSGGLSDAEFEGEKRRLLHG